MHLSSLTLIYLSSPLSSTPIPSLPPPTPPPSGSASSQVIAQGGARSEDGRTAVSANNIMSPQDEEKGGKTMRRKRITLQGALTAVHDRYISYSSIPSTPLPYHPFYPPTHPTSSPPYCLSILLFFHRDLPQTLHTPSLSSLSLSLPWYTSLPLNSTTTSLHPSHPLLS